MSEEILLNEAAYSVWQTVKERGPIELGEVVRLTGIDQAQVSAVAKIAESQNYFRLDERIAGYKLIFTPVAKDIVSNRLPERRAIEQLNEAGGEMSTEELVAWTKSVGIALNEVFKWGGERGWISRKKGSEGGSVALTAIGKKALTKLDEDEELFQKLLFSDHDHFVSLADARYAAWLTKPLLSKRNELVKIKARSERILSLTDAGREALRLRVRKVVERNLITHEDLVSGAALTILYRPYDINLAADVVHPAKIHPLRKIIEQTRRAFLEMGFAEVVSPMVESAFWNFDALFQPQDHPARDMQDTFYMREPASAPLPGEELQKGVRPLLCQATGGTNPNVLQKKRPDPFLNIVDQVRRTHENGWTTGSEGWGYTWSPERSQQVVLRTHTTAATIRALAANPNPPGKFFCVGWTYRNETISFKHLPVFHQVDGIIIDEEANLASLMGTLQEFYSKMGFGRVKFKPAFYPYTEPSVDVVVYMESRKKWLEMGGAGIFRPEVTLPLGCSYPVLAWGLGIERLAMLRFGLSDIRDLYRANLDALEEVPLCR